MSPPGIREPVAAGTFYPSDAGRLSGMVDRMLSEVVPRPDEPTPAGLVVPHAGYVYSGPVAATAYALLASAVAPQPARVAVLGPAHFVSIRGSAVPAAAAWETPLGTVQVDAELVEAATTRGSAVNDAPHAAEHAVEVQLPFLQRILGSTVRVLPVAVGPADPDEAASLIDGLVEAGAFVIVTTDLSHYLDHRSAQAIDARTARAVTARDAGSIGLDDACGVHALRGLVAYARNRGGSFTVLDLRTSADTAGDPSRVVGYGAFALYPSEPVGQRKDPASP